MLRFTSAIQQSFFTFHVRIIKIINALVEFFCKRCKLLLHLRLDISVHFLVLRRAASWWVWGLSPLLLWQSLFGWESIPLLLCQPLAHLIFWYNCQQGADSFYLSIAKALCGTDYKIASVCLSVIAPIRSQCWIEFYELCTAVLVEKLASSSLGGQNPIMPSPILHPIFTNFHCF